MHSGAAFFYSGQSPDPCANPYVSDTISAKAVNFLLQKRYNLAPLKVFSQSARSSAG